MLICFREICFTDEPLPELPDNYEVIYNATTEMWEEHQIEEHQETVHQDTAVVHDASALDPSLVGSISSTEMAAKAPSFERTCTSSTQLQPPVGSIISAPVASYLSVDSPPAVLADPPTAASSTQLQPPVGSIISAPVASYLSVESPPAVLADPLTAASSTQLQPPVGSTISAPPVAPAPPAAPVKSTAAPPNTTSSHCYSPRSDSLSVPQ